jgi:hypothetical protein
MPPAVGCGPRAPAPLDGLCDIGVVGRLLVADHADCTEARFQALTRDACRVYRSKNAGKPLDEFDPARPIYVSRALEHFDRHGNLINAPEIDNRTCPPPPRFRP